MTRFIMSLDEAVDLVLFAFQNGGVGRYSCSESTGLHNRCACRGGKGTFLPEAEIKVIGIRHGEKMYETLLTNEECLTLTDMGNFYRVPCDKRSLNYDKYFNDGDKDRNPLTEFNSNNTELLNVEQVKEKLLSLAYIRGRISRIQEVICIPKGSFFMKILVRVQPDL